MNMIRQACEKRLAELKREREAFVGHWRELSEFLLPRRGRFLTSDRNQGDKRNGRIIDNTATLAVRTLASGMMAGVTSPARAWFRLGTPDPELMERGPVRVWLHDVESRMREVFARSNLYNVLPTLYEELGVFGTAAMIVVEDFADVIRCYPMTAGEYMIANGPRLEVDTLYREVSLTAAQAVAEFGREALSRRTLDLYERGATETWIDFVHVIEPNDDRIEDLADAAGKPWRSVWYEKGADVGSCARISGFDGFPAMAPRWHLRGGDVYGSSPGMEALGDVKALQVEQKRKAQGIDKMVNPPMVAPSSLKSQPATVLPGKVTFVDVSQGQQGFQPAYLVNPRLAELGQDIAETQGRINRAFYADLFLMLAQSDRRQITAREIDERHEEKLLMLGPVLERLHGELLDPLIDRTFAIMMRGGLVPPPPRDLGGTDLKVEYISLLAQAQRAVGTAGISQLTGFVGGLAAGKPEVLDKLDLDQAVDEMGSMLGVPPRLIVPDDKVAEIRAGRARAQQGAAMAAALQSAAAGAKTLAQAPAEGRNALTDVLGRLRRAQGGAP